LAQALSDPRTSENDPRALVRMDGSKSGGRCHETDQRLVAKRAGAGERKLDETRREICGDGPRNAASEGARGEEGKSTLGTKKSFFIKVRMANKRSRSWNLRKDHHSPSLRWRGSPPGKAEAEPQSFWGESAMLFRKGSPASEVSYSSE